MPLGELVFLCRFGIPYISFPYVVSTRSICMEEGLGLDEVESWATRFQSDAGEERVCGDMS